MANNEMDFVLPIGYQDENGELHREGTMRLATALDEIEVHNDEKSFSSERFHDVLLMARIIPKIGTISAVSVAIIQNLYEVDFRYLQTLYKEINGQLENEIKVKCPKCNHIDKIHLSEVYKKLDFYFKKSEE